MLVLLALLVSGGSASAQALTVNGTINQDSPAMPVVFIITPNCTAQGASLVHYNSIPFTVTAGGDYTVSLTSTDNNASFYIYEIAFDPNDGLTNCIAGANSGTPKSVTEPLTAGVQYFAVPINDDFVQTLTIDYQLDFSGPGQIIIRSAMPIPTLSQWGLITLVTALAFLASLQLQRRES
jgi:hypothetical protein